MSGVSHHITLAPEGLPHITLRYIAHGEEHQPVVLCIHGLTCNAHDFDILARRLSDDFYVIAMDMPGRGESEPHRDPQHYDNVSNVFYVFDALDKLGIDSVHWVGASMGGIMAMIANQLRPGLIKSLMLNDVGAMLPGQGLKDIIDALKMRETAFNSLDACEAMLRSYAKDFNITSDAMFEAFADSRILKREDGTYSFKNDPNIVLPLLALDTGDGQVEDISLLEQWELVRCPVLLFRGEYSTLLTRDVIETMRKTTNAPFSFHEIAHTGHMPHLMDEVQTTIIRNWLLKQQ